MGRKRTAEQKLIRQEMQFTKKWTESLVFRIYDLVKQGSSESKIAKILGIDVSTLRKWKQNKAYVAFAFEEGKAVRTSGEGSNAVTTFEEYVYSNLPPDLQRVWAKIVAYQEEDNTVRKVEALLANKGDNVKKHLFIHALVANDFNMSEACRLTNTALHTVNEKWKKDPDFVRLLAEIEEHRDNFFENALVNLIKRGDSSAVIFANRTRNRDRGYSEKTTVEVTGSINHYHNVVSMTELDLPIDTRRQILASMRALKEPEVEVTPAPYESRIVKEIANAG